MLSFQSVRTSSVKPSTKRPGWLERRGLGQIGRVEIAKPAVSSTQPVPEEDRHVEAE